MGKVQYKDIKFSIVDGIKDLPDSYIIYRENEDIFSRLISSLSREIILSP